MNERQSAMKFPMTSGWTIFAFLVAVGVLASFGVQDAIGHQIPERCALGPPLSCSESGVSEDGVSLILSNTDSRIMEIQKIEIVSDVTGDCFWEAPFPFDYSNSTAAYPKLESGNPPVVYTLTSNSRANDGNGTFIPKSAEGAVGTRVNPDNNANWGAPDNSSLAGCAFNPKNSRARNQYEFTITYNWYNWKNSEITHSVSGSFVAENPIHSWKRDLREFVLDDLNLPFILFFILYLFLALWAFWNHARSKQRR